MGLPSCCRGKNSCRCPCLKTKCIMRRILSMVGSGERFYLLCVSLPQFEEPLLDPRRLDRQWSQISPAGNNALDEVSLVGLDGGKRLGAGRIRLVDPPLVFDVVLTELTKRARLSLEGLYLVDGFAQLLTIGLPGRVGFLGPYISYKTDRCHVFDAFSVRKRCVIAKNPRHTLCTFYLANTSLLIPGHQILLRSSPGARKLLRRI